MKDNTKPPRSYWPIGIVAYFALALIFLISFIVWASRQREDLVSENYYDKEVRYQQQLDQMNRAQPLQSQIAVAYDAVLQNIVITLPAGQALKAVGQIRLYRPSDARLDRDLPLAVDAAGLQRLDAKDLSQGLWKVRVRWNVGGEDFFVDRSVVVKPVHT